MSIEVSLKAVVFEMEGQFEGSTAYLNRKTGELHTISEELIDEVEDDHSSDLPAWQKQELDKAREIEGSEDWLALPSKFDIHEYDIMARFSASYPDEKVSADLNDAIRGGGAFQRFKSLIRRRGIEQEWYRYREEALLRLAIEWLEENKIAFKMDSD